MRPGSETPGSSSSACSEPIERIAFGIFSPEEIRAVSVKQIVNPTTLDQLERPVPGGLYDPAMGPIDKHSCCMTCGLHAFHCPGHLGHIELSHPFYNPAFFMHMFRTLKACCLYCHHFRLSEDAKNSIIASFEALEKRTQTLGLHAKDMPLEQEKRDLISTFFRTTSKKCENCGMTNPTLRQEARERIFRLPLSGVALLLETQRGVRVSDVIGRYKSSLGVSLPSGSDQSDDDSGNHSSSTGRSSSTTSGSDSDNDGPDDGHEEPTTRRAASRRKSRGTDGKSGNSEEGETEADPADVIDSLEEVASLGGSKSAGAMSGGRSDAQMSDQLSSSSSKPIFMTSMEVSAHMQLLLENERKVLSRIFPAGPTDSLFFMEVLAVPSNKFRPIQVLGSGKFENPQNSYFSRIIRNVLSLRELSEDRKLMLDTLIDTQKALNALYDARSADSSGRAPPGIRQLLEKKQGMFRQHMMGKRVNFAARSVINPDPNLSTSEIGVPLYFATKLTYPTPVTEWNVKELQQAVVNGPFKHPGANYVEDSRGAMIDLAHKTDEQREALSKTLLLGSKVLRHLKNNDILIVNRQPSLHKPSMMCHRARVLHSDHKVIRMHYANCNTYNADFDGDEMNLHFPQSEPARAEAYEIAANDHQYVVPTSGRPIRGLIQDHVGSGVLLTKRDTFFTRSEVQQLVFASLSGSVLQQDPHQQRHVHHRIRMVPPCIRKPRELWTGKQVISIILISMFRDARQRSLLNLHEKAKVSAAEWGTQAQEESIVIIRQGELLTGVLDKAAFGASEFGLIHAVYECYGAAAAAELLTVLGKLFTLFLQYHGYTCGVDDLLLSPACEARRKELLSVAERDCIRVSTGNVGRPGKELDALVKRTLTQTTSALIKELRMAKSFPHNFMSLMTVSGAKGGMVNQSQISCLLGQQEFEGRRVTATASGKTLPSFLVDDPSARAGGFISQRFLTGIKPQEYFFHCMAGRDGLIDTAVKTSRSGYLQRCLVKHLEGLSIKYDRTVRDQDGSVVQFLYGEDGIDTMKTRYLFNKSDFLQLNRKVLSEQWNAEESLRVLSMSSLEPDQRIQGVHLNAASPRFLSSLATAGAQGKGHADGIDIQALELLKFAKCLVEPGDNVGLLAAQSVGEPSTQMTLNTFHFAGVDAAHVTVGIPRLRELLMTGSCKTPMTSVAMPASLSLDLGLSGEEVALAHSRIPYAEIVERIDVADRLFCSTETAVQGSRGHISALNGNGLASRRWRIFRLECLLFEEYHRGEQWAEKMVEGFVSVLCRLYDKEVRSSKAAAAFSATAEEGEFAGAKKKELSADALPVDGEGNGARGGSSDEEDDADGESDGSERGDSSDDSDDQDDDDSMEDEEQQDEHEEQQEVGRHQNLSESESEDEGNAIDSPMHHKTKLAETAVLLEKQKQKRALSEASFQQLRQELVDKMKAKYQFIHSISVVGAQGSTETRPALCVELLLDQHSRAALRRQVAQTRATVGRKVPLMGSMLEEALRKSYYYSSFGIGGGSNVKRVTFQPAASGSSEGNLVMEGNSFALFWQLFVDYPEAVNRLTCNDVGAILRTYGVEAARRSIQNELVHVFDAYGIPVDVRHLGLIADYMTQDGGYRPFNRIGIVSNTSPFGKMTFETSMKFLTDACLAGDWDSMEGPSARIVAGQPVKSGTGCCDLLVPLAADH